MSRSLTKAIAEADSEADIRIDHGEEWEESEEESAQARQLWEEWDTFVRRVEGLREAAELDGTPVGAVAAAAALHRVAARDREARAQRAEADVHLRALARQRESAETDEAKAQAALASLQRSHDLPDEAALAEAAAAGRRLLDLQADCEHWLDELRRQADPGHDLEELMTGLATMTPEDVDLALERATRAEEQAKGAQVDAHRRHGEAIAERDQLPRRIGSGAAVAQARLTESAAAVADSVEQYILADLQREVLKRTLARYQERHASPLLAEAGRILVLLTEGRYTELRPVDAGDRQRLGVLRFDREPLTSSSGCPKALRTRCSWHCASRASCSGSRTEPTTVSPPARHARRHPRHLRRPPSSSSTARAQRDARDDAGAAADPPRALPTSPATCTTRG